MSRVGFVIALPKGRNPDELPNVETERLHGDVWQLTVENIGAFYVNVVRKNLTLPVSSIGTDGKWTVAIVYPIGRDWKEATRSFRKFRRYSDRYPARLQGPISIARAKELGIIVSVDWVIAGDDIPHLEAIDYRPTQVEVDSDIEANEAELFVAP